MKCDICGNELEDKSVFCPKCGNLINNFDDDYIESDDDCEYNEKLSVAERILLIPTDEESTRMQQKEQRKKRMRVLMSMVIVIMLSFVIMIILFKNDKEVHDNIYYVNRGGSLLSIYGDVLMQSDDYMWIYNDRNSALASFVEINNSVETVKIINTKTNSLYYDKNSDFGICKGYDIAYKYDYINDHIEFYNINNLEKPYATATSPKGYDICDFIISANGEKIAVFFESEDILYRAENEYRNYYTIIDKVNIDETNEYYNCDIGDKMITDSGIIVNIKTKNIFEICNNNKCCELGKVKAILFDSKDEYTYILEEEGLYRISCHNKMIGKKELISAKADNIYAITTSYDVEDEIIQENCYVPIKENATLLEDSNYIFFMENNTLFQYELKTGKEKKLMELDSKATKIYYLENEECIAVTNSYIYDVSLKKTISKYYNTVAICPTQTDDNCAIYFINGENILVKYDTYKNKENEIYENVQIFYVYEDEIIFYSGKNNGYYYYDGNKEDYITDNLYCNWYSGTYNDEDDANNSNCNMPIITDEYIYYLTNEKELIRYEKNSGIKKIIKDKVKDLYYLPYYK